MDEHPLGRPLDEALQTDTRRILTRAAARDRLQKAQTFRRPVVKLAVAGMDHHPHPAHAGVRSESDDGVAQHSLAVEIEVGFGHRPTEPPAPARGQHQRVDGRCWARHISGNPLS